MGALKSEVLRCLPSSKYSSTEATNWDSFLKLLSTQDLETALFASTVSEGQLKDLVSVTWNLISKANYEVFENYLSNRGMFSLTQLFSHFFKSTHHKVDVITSNYDCLVEFAAEAGGFEHWSGFSNGYRREKRNECGVHSSKRLVNICKVHGSLDWFLDSNNVPVALPICSHTYKDMMPIIITPGIEKFRKTYDEPYRSLIGEADNALKTARGYFCLGYGFNDAHLQTKMIERAYNDNVPIIVLAKNLTDSAKKIILSGKVKSYLAFEEKSDGLTTIHSDGGTEIVIKGNYWKLDEFLKRVI